MPHLHDVDARGVNDLSISPAKIIGRANADMVPVGKLAGVRLGKALVRASVFAGTEG